jgi:hypothetical protein
VSCATATPIVYPHALGFFLSLLAEHAIWRYAPKRTAQSVADECGGLRVANTPSAAIESKDGTRSLRFEKRGD